MVTGFKRVDPSDGYWDQFEVQTDGDPFTVYIDNNGLMGIGANGAGPLYFMDKAELQFLSFLAKQYRIE